MACEQRITLLRRTVADRESASAGDLLVDRYRLCRRLTAHGRSDVWRARDEGLDRTVVVKHVAVHAGAVQEARAAATVTHPGIVRVYDVIHDRSGGGWLIMEDLSGASLGAVLRDEHQLCAQEVAFIGLQVLKALAALHSGGLVHRDLKPSNVQLTTDGRVVLLDFGLAVAPCTTGGAAVAPIAGSVPFLAPEIFEHGEYSASSDLFALGMTLLTSVSGLPLRQLGSELGLSELTRLASHVASRLSEHAVLLTVIFGLLDRRVESRMNGDAALRMLASATRKFI